MKNSYTFRHSIRILAVVLTITVLIVSLPLTAFAVNLTSGSEESTEDHESDISSELLKDPFEVVELREENVKHFRLEDGSYVAAQYDMPVHYLDDNGEWQDIDNTLLPSGSEYATSNAKIKFANKITGNETLFSLHDGNRKVTMRLNDAIKKTSGKAVNNITQLDESATTLQKMMTLDHLTSEIVYSNILKGIDLQYIVESGSVKENIIVNEKRPDYVFVFTIKLNNLEAVLGDDGSVNIFDPEKKKPSTSFPADICMMQPVITLD